VLVSLELESSKAALYGQHRENRRGWVESGGVPLCSTLPRCPSRERLDRHSQRFGGAEDPHASTTAYMTYDASRSVPRTTPALGGKYRTNARGNDSLRGAGGV